MNFSNIKKTIYYCKRNGVAATVAAVRERLAEKKQAPYAFVPTDAEKLAAQRAHQWEEPVVIDIVVPLYRTPREYLKRMIASVQAQTYPHWHLILADATEGEGLRDEIAAGDPRISYHHLASNDGISANTNAALAYATGDYIGLLDHDDVLTPDALYEMVAAIQGARAKGISPRMLYSDEDKCNEDETLFYEPHFKENFNYDLLLSNNYICHFLVMEAGLLRKLNLRPEFDGAQDFDLVLRASEVIRDEFAALRFGKASCGNEFCETAGETAGKTASETTGKTVIEAARKVTDETAGDTAGHAAWQEQIIHVPKVLYHWRCHSASTAENPESKRYAYEAGRRAVQAAIERNGWNAQAKETAHVGFYRVEYLDKEEEGIGNLDGRNSYMRKLGTEHREGILVKEVECVFTNRPEIGAVGGPVISGGRILSGRIEEDGLKPYAGLPRNFSGYMHRASMQQDVDALDLRNIAVRKECRALFQEVVGVPYAAVQIHTDGEQTSCFDAATLPADADIDALSIAFGQALRERGYYLLYDSKFVTKV